MKTSIQYLLVAGVARIAGDLETSKFDKYTMAFVSLVFVVMALLYACMEARHK